MDAIRHLPNMHRFVVEEQGEESVLHYRLFDNAGKPAIDFNSTYVPQQSRGKGVAEKLVREGIKWAKEQGYELHASCWYAAKFIR